MGVHKKKPAYVGNSDIRLPQESHQTNEPTHWMAGGDELKEKKKKEKSKF